MARPSWRRGMAPVMIATLLAWNMAAPTPCSARKPMRASRLGANPHKADPSTKITNPYV